MDILRLISYKNWADEEILKLCEQVTDEEFDFKPLSTGKCIREVLSHILEVQWFWHQLISERNFNTIPNPDLMGKGEIIEELRKSNEALHFFTQTADLSDKVRLQWEESDNPYDAPFEDILFNLVTHNAHHRGQVGLLLRELGLVPPDLDFNPFSYRIAQGEIVLR